MPYVIDAITAQTINVNSSLTINGQPVVPGGGGLEGTNYVYVSANGTPTENAAELQAAYDKAATLVNLTSSWVSFGLYGAMSYGKGDYEVYFNPSTDFFKPNTTYSLKINGIEYTGTTTFAYGSSAYFTTNAPAGLTITSFEALDVVVKRATVIAAPGYYDFGNSAFVMNQEYVDLVSLDGNRSVVFNSANSSGTISITANDVFVKGVDVQDKNFTIVSNLNLLRVENCKGGNNSFGYGDFTFVTSGTFINCEGGNNSFGANGICSGTFIDCIGGNGSFGYFGTVSGTFTNCKGGASCFGADGGNCSGTFTNCTGENNSFANYGKASGTFINCIGKEYSFANNGEASGTFINCIGGSASFGTYNTASGIFTNCIGGIYSFGYNDVPELTGKLFYCQLTSGTFPTVSGGGKTLYCIDGNNNPDNQGFTPQNKV